MSFDEHIIIGFMNNVVSNLIRLIILFVFLKSICNLINLVEEKNKFTINIMLKIKS